MSLPARVEDRSPVVAGLALMDELERAGVVTRAGIDFTRVDLTFDQCESLAAMCGEVKRWSEWAIGDLLAYSERKFGELWPQIEAATGLQEQTGRNYQSVCRRIPLHRRRPHLGISLHQAVTRFLPEEQERWLAYAEAHQLKRDELRAAIKAEEQPDACVHEYVCRKCGEVHQ